MGSQRNDVELSTKNCTCKTIYCIYGNRSQGINKLSDCEKTNTYICIWNCNLQFSSASHFRIQVSKFLFPAKIKEYLYLHVSIIMCLKLQINHSQTLSKGTRLIESVTWVWPRSIYLSRGWSVVTNPSRGFSRDWDVTTDHPRLRLIYWGQTTGNRLFFSYRWHVNKPKTNAPEVQYQTGSTRQKNLALDFRSDFLVRCTRNVFVKHGCPRRQQSPTFWPSPTQGLEMLVKCEEPIDELTIQV